mmetsp:Transcript_43466/g.50013  ORF Transcript_43466/g.50013 Transcript_43466/m.50013 type:complete len:361 (-) Transcript_43466:237-1319(-)
MGAKCCMQSHTDPGKSFETAGYTLTPERKKAAVVIIQCWKKYKARMGGSQIRGKFLKAMPAEENDNLKVLEREKQLGAYTFTNAFMNPRMKKPFEQTDGTVYIGFWKDGFKKGPGIQINVDGSKYEGEWSLNKHNGEGRMVYADGSYYIGGWVDGDRHGQGVFVDETEGKYNGQWFLNRKDGSCVEEWADGAKYEGTYIKGRRDGEGTFTWADGSKYKGQFKNGKMHGQGHYEWANGNVYEGSWKNGMQNGVGKLKTNAGLYEGNFRDNKREGFGTYTNKAGDVFHGEWRENQQNGKGMIKMSTGKQRIGMWLTGRLSNWLPEGEKFEIPKFTEREGEEKPEVVVKTKEEELIDNLGEDE